MKLNIPILMTTAVLLCAQMVVAQAPDSKAKKPLAGTTKRVDVNEFEKLWNAKTNVVLDVRTPKEFASGHIPGAINIDIKNPNFQQQIAKLKKDQPYLVHCGAGVRSARACEEMSRAGFTNLVDLAPGFKAWEKAGKPVEK